MANTRTANASLPKPIDEAQIFQDVENLQTAFNNAMNILETLVGNSGNSVAVTTGNATILNTTGKRIVYINAVSAGSIATITGMVQDVPFHIIAQSGASFGIVDVGSFELSASLIFTAGDTLTLVWDGSRYYELDRSVN